MTLLKQIFGVVFTLVASVLLGEGAAWVMDRVGVEAPWWAWAILIQALWVGHLVATNIKTIVALAEGLDAQFEATTGKLRSIQASQAETRSPERDEGASVWCRKCGAELTKGATRCAACASVA